MLQVRWLDDDGAEQVDPTELARRLARDDVAGFGWVDLPRVDPSDRAALRALGLPELAVEDLVDDRHQPKVDRVGDVVVLVVHGLDLDTLGEELRTVELDLVVADRLLVTCHDGRVASVAALAARADEGALRFDRPLALLHRLLDTMNDVFVPFVEHLDRRLDLIEEEVLDDPTEETRRDIYALQRDLIQLRRVMVPQAEVVRRLQREQAPGWQDGDEALVRDLVDHLQRIAELSASYQALLESAMTSYRSALEDRLNDMLRTLTVISAVLLPVTVVAGLFGMNFVALPGTGAPNGFWWTLAGSAGLVLSMLGWFAHRGWIGRRAQRAAAARRSALETVLEVPLLGSVLRVPVASGRAVGRVVDPRRVRRRRTR